MLSIYQLLINNGYVWETEPAEMQKDKHKVFIRHDVDVSLRMAYQLALTEKEVAVKSVFFVMVNSPFYNIQEKEQNELLRKIHDRGFQIGLHANVQKDSHTDEIEALVQVQRQILEISLGFPITLMSFHHPSAQERSLDFKDRSLFNVYRLSEFGILYLSDSNMKLDIRALHAAVKQGKNMQILIHPVWWCSGVERPGDVWEKIIAEKVVEMRTIIESTERSYEGNS